MLGTRLSENSLVLYKSHPARVLNVAEKLQIELDAGKTKRVRNKDVLLLHGGPLESLTELKPQTGEVEEAWELLAGGTTTLAELAELVFGEHTPATAWAAWLLVTEGLYFSGTPDALHAHTPEQVAQERQRREAKAAEESAWSDFITRLRSSKLIPEDAYRISDVELLARGRSDRSRILRELGRQETPEKAHALLLKIGHWQESTNPYPTRFQLSTEPCRSELPGLPEENRRDLTHLPAFAIDDEGNQDPDDAISLDGERLWVHVADVAAAVRPETTSDLEARSRGATLYLPEQTIPMLAPEAVEQLGLGLREVSPALSFGLQIGERNEISGVEIVRSWVHVTRISYAEAQRRLTEEPFASLWHLAKMFRERRRVNGALEIRLPEVVVRVIDGEVSIRTQPALESRTMVTEMMLQAGHAAARFALEHDIPFPFSTQVLPEAEVQRSEDMAAMYALRKQLKRSQTKSTPEAHAGLGLDMYSQVTSPLRRYLDLLAHQQLRAYLRGEPVLTEQEVMMRVGAAEAVTGNIRAAERSSNRHWTLVYLRHRPQWCGEGMAVERRGKRTVLLIPELGLDTTVSIGTDAALNTPVKLALEGTDLATLSVHFRPLS